MSSAADVENGGAVAHAHDVDLRRVVQSKLLLQMVKRVTQRTRGWVVLVVDDATTRILSQVARMSDLTDCGVSLLERLELARQPFPEMSAVYFLSPTVEAVRKLARDFADERKPTYKDVYLYFLHHADEDVLTELKSASPSLLQRLKSLQEVNVDFLALEKSVFSFDMPSAFRALYSPLASEAEKEELTHHISAKLVSVCATLEEYPFVRFKADQPRMQALALAFQTKMNAFVAQNEGFVYAPKRGTLLFLDRGQDLVTPLMHESTFQALTYDLLDVQNDQISYTADTNAGPVTKTAILNDNDKLWVEFRHTHIAEVSAEIGKRMAALSASSAGSSLGKGKSTDLHAMAAALRELPEYREMLGKLSQHLFLAGKAMDIFTSTKLLEASHIEQTMATGVDEAGRKLKKSNVRKQLDDLFKESKLTQSDRFRIAAIFALTQDTMKDVDRSKVQQMAALSKESSTALANMHLVGGAALYKQNAISSISAEELKAAAKKAEAVAYSNARYEPKLKLTAAKALQGTLSESEYPYLIAPPAPSKPKDDKKKVAAVSLRKRTIGKSRSQDTTAVRSPCFFAIWKTVVHGELSSLTPWAYCFDYVMPTAAQEKDGVTGEKMIVFICGGAAYSELRSIYEVREEERRDVVVGSTSLLRPHDLIESLTFLREAAPAPPASPPTSHGAEVMPLTGGEIHLQMEAQREKL